MQLDIEWVSNGCGRLKGLSVVAENGTAKAGSLISCLGTSSVLFLILSIFCLSSSLSSMHRARYMVEAQEYLFDGFLFWAGIWSRVERQKCQKRLF